MSKGIKTCHIPDIHKLTLCITYRCNLCCSHCSSAIDQAPSNEIMSLETVKEIITESIVLNWPWKTISLYGGEPTMHPQLTDICRLLQNYKLHNNPSVRLGLTTNGIGFKVLVGIEVAKSFGFAIDDSSISQRKYNTLKVRHIPYYHSPVDLGEDYFLGCHLSSSCGIICTNKGYYECNAAGAAYRLLDYEPMAIKLKDVTVESMIKGYTIHCKHCGFARNLGLCGNSNAKVGSFTRRLFNFTLRLASNPRASITKTWQEAINKYKKEQQNTKQSG